MSEHPKQQVLGHLSTKHRRFVIRLQNSVLSMVTRARPYKGHWYIITVTPKGKRRDTLYLYENFYKELPTVKSIDYAVVVRELSDDNVEHFHGLVHTKNPNKFLKLKKSKTMTYLIHPYWDIYSGETYWLEYMGKCSPSHYILFYKKKFLLKVIK